MKNIKPLIKFIIKLLLVLICSYGLYELSFWYLWKFDGGINAYDNAYQHALLRQYNVLEDENREPGIIITGASIVPFGIDNKTIEDITGRPVQILGVEASLRAHMLLHILEDTAKPGDTIVFMLSQGIVYKEDYIPACMALEADKEKLEKFMQWRDGEIMYYKESMIWRKLYSLSVGNIIEAVRSTLSTKEQVYSIDSFDDNGNMCLEREGSMITCDEPYETLSFENVDQDTLDALNTFNSWCKENDIDLYVVYSMYIDDSILSSEEEIDYFDSQIKTYLDCEVLGVPQDYIMDISYFYNTGYHLNSEGAKIYSEKLANYLISKSE